MKIAKLFPALLALALLLSGVGCKAISNWEYQKLDETQLRAKILKHTPVGTNAVDVQKFIALRLWCNPELKRGCCRRGWSFPEAGKPNPGDMLIDETIDYYDFKPWELSSHYVMGWWLFDEHGDLKDVMVVKGFDSL